jgi:hypothetical protein
MGTKNPRIAAYVPESIYSKFQVFKDDRKIGDSQALVQILSEYFGVTHLVSRDESLQTLERIARLEESLSHMRSDLLSELKESVLKELDPQSIMFAISPSRVEPEVVQIQPEVVDVAPEVVDVVQISDLPQDTQQALVDSSEDLSIAEDGSSSKGLSPVDDIDKIFLTGGQLRRRLKAADSTMSNKRNSPSDVFASWSAKLDPDGLSWVLNSDGKFSPIGNVTPEIRSGLLKIIPTGLSNNDLAKRLKLDASTLSHWKKNKSLEEFLRDVRAKDPEGIGWVLNEDTKRFVPDSSGSLRMTQSELPGISSLGNDDF